MENYRVRCGYHHYDTGFTCSKATAIGAAQMHALLPCTWVEVTDRAGNIYEWRTGKEGTSESQGPSDQSRPQGVDDEAQ